MPGIAGCIRANPKGVNQVVVRAERRETVRGTADEGSEEAVLPEPGSPGREGKRGRALGNKQKEQDKRPENLRLVDGRAPHGWIKSGEIIHRFIGVKEPEFCHGSQSSECSLPRSEESKRALELLRKHWYSCINCQYLIIVRYLLVIN
uniref:hypothetical protein n=1 Tax=Enterocloster clostridioformis TaxID=1531 RepID=UPI0025B2278E